MGQGELEALGEELLDVRAADALVVLDLNDTENLIETKSVNGHSPRRMITATYVNGAKAGTVTGSHIKIESLDGISTAQFTEFLVHVVRSRTRIVTNPDAKVLDFQGLTFVDL